MATTTDTHKLLLDGAWIETRESIEVRSPYSGDVVGRVAKAGAREARRAVDAARGHADLTSLLRGHSGTLAHTSFPVSSGTNEARTRLL